MSRRCCYRNNCCCGGYNNYGYNNYNGYGCGFGNYRFGCGGFYWLPLLFLFGCW